MLYINILSHLWVKASALKSKRKNFPYNVLSIFTSPIKLYKLNIPITQRRSNFILPLHSSYLSRFCSSVIPHTWYTCSNTRIYWHLISEYWQIGCVKFLPRKSQDRLDDKINETPQKYLQILYQHLLGYRKSFNGVKKVSNPHPYI